MQPYTLWVLALSVPLLVVAAGAQKEPADGLDVYFRDADLGALSDQALAKYTDTDPGESEKLERAFDGAPPQISHTVEDMLPIVADENDCLDCHDPETAGADDLPMPDSHLERAVMAESKGPGMVWVVQKYEKADAPVGARYSCTMCHTPQATNVDTPRNLFRSDSPDMK
jgi:cytochrome c-type protein NapB